jgi:hypothetical protein
MLLFTGVTFLASYVGWYFVIMRDDLTYFFVLGNPFGGALPDYPPALITGIAVITTLVIGLLSAVAFAFARWRKHAAT